MKKYTISQSGIYILRLMHCIQSTSEEETWQCKPCNFNPLHLLSLLRRQKEIVRDRVKERERDRGKESRRVRETEMTGQIWPN